MNTHLPKPIFRPMPLVYKIACMVLIAGFVIVGLLGLILPIIPGVLFLFLAALLLTRVSRRAATFAHSQPWFHRNMHRWQASGGLSAGQRVKLGFLLSARILINGTQKLFSYLFKGPKS
ncbi:MAG: DUF454 family protein [Pseudohongiella sp.]|nr:DUF454 family protein [Pseudohongiella sp.]MDO9521278.1 DUF454 family protein [Pseudohongiella sp.]MDP2127265.1 DUF454 family protein [Pseudohongiella sp.]